MLSMYDLTDYRRWSQSLAHYGLWLGINDCKQEISTTAFDKISRDFEPAYKELLSVVLHFNSQSPQSTGTVSYQSHRSTSNSYSTIWSYTPNRFFSFIAQRDHNTCFIGDSLSAKMKNSWENCRESKQRLLKKIGHHFTMWSEKFSLRPIYYQDIAVCVINYWYQGGGSHRNLSLSWTWAWRYS